MEDKKVAKEYLKRFKAKGDEDLHFTMRMLYQRLPFFLTAAVLEQENSKDNAYRNNRKI